MENCFGTRPNASCLEAMGLMVCSGLNWYLLYMGVLGCMVLLFGRVSGGGI